jgi:multicomponent Na+:H+ antiporter subunit F
MDRVLFSATVVILVGIGLVLLRAIQGPTVYDRVLAANTIGTKTVILVALLGFQGRHPGFLDIALLYTLINFLATIAVLKFRQLKRLG